MLSYEDDQCCLCLSEYENEWCRSCDDFKNMDIEAMYGPTESDMSEWFDDNISLEQVFY